MVRKSLSLVKRYSFAGYQILMMQAMLQVASKSPFLFLLMKPFLLLEEIITITVTNIYYLKKAKNDAMFSIVQADVIF